MERTPNTTSTPSQGPAHWQDGTPKSTCNAFTGHVVEINGQPCSKPFSDDPKFRSPAWSAYQSTCKGRLNKPSWEEFCARRIKK